MIKGTAEFYRNYPNVKKGQDGRYHIYYVNNGEPFRGYRQDTMEEISAMRGILPTAIKASEILGVDSDLRHLWYDLLNNLAPLPTTCDRENSSLRYSSISPTYSYDLATLETDNPEVARLAQAAFFPNGFDANTRIGVLSTAAVAASMLGRTDAVKIMLPDQIRCLSPETGFCYFVQTGRTGALANRMSLREGVNDLGAQRLGIIADALHLALCQSVPPGPGQDPVIRVFAAWPREWDAEYTLLCRRGFLVTSSMKKGRIEFVEIESQLGGECRLRNPWPGAEVALYRNHEKWKDSKGSLLEFETVKGQTFVVVVKGESPSQFKRIIRGGSEQ
jgi:hypothetical protein